MASYDFSLDDPVVVKALEIAAWKGKWSTAMIQTYLGKGHSYIARLTFWAEEAGLIGPYDGNKPRLIYYSSLKDAEKIILSKPTQNNIKHLPLEQLLNTKQLLARNPRPKNVFISRKMYNDYHRSLKVARDDGRLFISECLKLLREFFQVEYMAQFSPPYYFPFSKFVYAKIKDNNIPLFLYYYSISIQYLNCETVDIEPIFLQIYKNTVHQYRALYFIEKIGPHKAMDIIKNIVYAPNEVERSKLLKKLDRSTQGIISKRYNLFEYNHASVVDIENASAFKWQFKYLTLIDFTNAEHNAIIEKISNYSEKQIAKYAEQIAVYFFNYIFQIDKLCLNDIFNCAVHVFRCMPTSGNNVSALRALYISAFFIITYSMSYESCFEKYGGDLYEFLYKIFWPKIGGVWPIKNRSRIHFTNVIDEEIFEMSAKMLGSDFDIEKHNPEFATFLRDNIIFEKPFEDYWFISFLLRHNDIGFNSHEMLDKLLVEIQGGEFVPKKELMKKLCFLFSYECSANMLIDEVFQQHSPLRQFGSEFFEELFDYAEEEIFDELLEELINRFDEVIEICGKEKVYRIFLQICRESYKISNHELLENLAEIIKKHNLLENQKIAMALKAADKQVRIHELQNNNLG